MTDEKVFTKPAPTAPRPEAVATSSWESASRLSREISRAFVNFLDEVAKNDSRGEMEGFEGYLMIEERAMWSELKGLVKRFKAASGG